MRRVVLIASLVFATPQIAAAQATVGQQADEPVLPDPQPDQAEAATARDGSPAAQRTDAAQADELPPAEAQPAESQPTEAQSAESQPTEAQSADSQPTESQPTEAQPAESQPAEPTERAFIPAPEQVPEGSETPVLESWWFWAAMAAIVLGVTAAVIVDVTTDAPHPSPEPAETTMGLVLRL